MRQRAFKLVLVTALAALGLISPVGTTSALAQEPLSVDVSVQDATIDPRTGDVTISATVSCSEWSWVGAGFEVRQDLGRLQTIRGYSSTWGTWCPGPEGSPYTITVRAYEGKFGGGNARITMWAYAYRWDESGYAYANDSADLSVQLRPA
jgi:hypothetical protein